MPLLGADTSKDNFHLPCTESLSKKKNTEAAIIAIYPVKNVNAIGSSLGIAITSAKIIIKDLGFKIKFERYN